MAHLKLSDDKYIDATGVSKDSTGQVNLQDWIDGVYQISDGQVVDCGLTDTKPCTDTWYTSPNCYTTDGWTTFNITFNKTFTKIPVVCASIYYPSGSFTDLLGTVNLVVSDTTLTGCTIRIVRFHYKNDSQTTVPMGVSWIAVQD